MAYEVQFVSCGDGRVAYSTNAGVDWSVGISSDGDNWVCVWCNGLEDQLAGAEVSVPRYWVALTTENTWVWSDASDGTVWTRVSSGVEPTATARALSYGGSRVWVIVGNGGHVASYSDITDGNSYTVADPTQFTRTEGLVTFNSDLKSIRCRKWNGTCTWFAGDNSGGVWKTTDSAGVTGWTISHQDVSTIRTWTDFEVDESTGRVYCAGSVNGLIYSDDNGETWTLVEGDLNGYPGNQHFTGWSYSDTLDRWVGTLGTRFAASDAPVGGVFDLIIQDDAYGKSGIDWNGGVGFTTAAFVAVGHQGRVWQSTDGVTFTLVEGAFESAAENDVCSYRYPYECACSPYLTVTAEDASTVTGRQTGRSGIVRSNGVNQAASFTDNMWCRRGDTIVPGDISVQGIRVDGI